MAAGEAFERDQHERIERARRAAEAQTGMRFWLRVGEYDGDKKLEAEHLLANLVDTSRDAAALVLVAPGARQVEIMTTSAGKRRLTDQACGLVVLAMTSSFAVGDLVGGLVTAFRQLSDAAGGPPAEMLPPATAAPSLLGGRSPVPNRALEGTETDILEAEESLGQHARKSPARH